MHYWSPFSSSYFSFSVYFLLFPYILSVFASPEIYRILLATMVAEVVLYYPSSRQAITTWCRPIRPKLVFVRSFLLLKDAEILIEHLSLVCVELWLLSYVERYIN